GNLDPTDEGFSKNLKRFAANKLFRGIRWRGDLVQIDATKDHVMRGAKELASLGLVLELNGKPSMLAQAAKIAREIPDLRIMIDHVGSAGDPAHLSDEWRDGIRLAGERRN